jgi:hypothetical protein
MSHAHLHAKFRKNVNSAKKICLKKFKMGIKNAEFHADFKSVEKVLKKIYLKIVISKNVPEICSFSSFTHVRQACFCL